jgi:hypothetical protein
VRRERALVDRHDHDPVGDALARHEPLPAVEDEVAEALDGRRRRCEQQGERGQQDERDDPERARCAQGSISSPSQAAETFRG